MDDEDDEEETELRQIVLTDVRALGDGPEHRGRGKVGTTKVAE